MRACGHPWGVYIQADEVLHERGAEELAAAIQRHDGDPRVEGLLVRYLHFYGGFDTIATHRRWYRREVRAVRLDPGARYPAVPGRAGLPGRSRSIGRSGRGSPTPRCSTTDGPARRRRCGKSASWGRRCTPGATPTNAGRCSPGCRASGRSAGPIRPSRESGSTPRRLDPERVIAPRRFRWRFLRYYVVRRDRAADRRPAVRVPQLHHGLMPGRTSSYPARPAAARAGGVGMMPSACARPAGRDPGALLGAIQIVARELSGLRGRAVPRAVPPVHGKASDVLDPGTEVESAAAENLPHAVRGGGTPAVLLGERMGAERDGGATDDLGQAAAVHRAADHRQVGRRVLPAGTADLEPATRWRPLGAQGSGGDTARSRRS